MCVLRDSGATDNFINIETLRQKQLGDVTLTKQQSVELASNDHTMRVLGEIDVEIKIMGRPFISHFLITEDLRHPVILGYEWMSEQNVVLDIAQQYIYIYIYVSQHLRSYKYTAFALEILFTNRNGSKERWHI